MAEHTALPWSLSEMTTTDNHFLVVGGKGQNFGLVAEAMTEATATYIVKAGNAYPALIRALEDLCDEIGHKEEHGDGADDSDCSICRAHKRARKLLRSLAPVKGAPDHG